MTAPVSLAEIKARKASLVSGLIGMTEAERDALVELACEAMTRRPIADTPAPPPPATDPHEPKEPRHSAFHGFLESLLGDERISRQEHDVLAEAYEIRTAERDEWKRRAEERECCRGEMAVSFASVAAKLAAMTERADKAEAERDAAREEVERLRTGVLAGTPPLVVTYRNWRGEVRERRITPRAVWFGSTHWHPEAQWMLDATDEETGDLRTFAFGGFLDAVCAERDAALKRCDKLEAFITYIESPALKAWRALDAEVRSYRVEDLRTWADLVEAGAAPDGADHGPSPLRIAAAALEALAEPRP